MERIIALSELQAAVNEAYEQFKSEKVGEISPLIKNADEKNFSIAVVLTDGTIIKKAETDVKVPMGSISKIPLFELLLSQYGVDKLVEMSGKCPCMGNGKAKEKPELPMGMSRHGIRATSAVQPEGDIDSKWNLIVNNMIDMMGSAPELDDDLYKAMMKTNEEAGVVDILAKAGYYLYDDAAMATDLFTRQAAMQASVEQLAIMGATIAADGVNPITGKIVFDGELAAKVTGMIAGHGPHRANKPWLVTAGLPVKSGFGGSIVGVFPGVMGIAAYAPGLSPTGFSVKAAQAIRYVMNKLDISVFESASIKIDKDK